MRNRCFGNVRSLVRLASALSVALVALPLTGCGGDDDASSTTMSTPTQPPTSTATATPTDTATPMPTPTPSVPNPSVEGPILEPGFAFIQSTRFDLSLVGYSQGEYFLSGMARGYTNTAPLASDGRWSATTAGSVAYKTRVVVYRPIDAGQFNGSVVVEWLNVSGGLDAAPDWTAAHTELIREGYAWVGVSAQFLGVEGREGGGPIPGLPDLSLKGVNPDRYESLDHPGDSFSYDIFSQVGQAIRHPVEIDLLGGLSAERLIAAGESQSAFRLVTYVNAVHPVVGVYDGFLIHSRGGSSAPLSQAPQEEIRSPEVVYVRDDLDVPVLMFQTETDLLLLGSVDDRQPDGPLFRLWEVAGTAHADTYGLIVGFTDLGDSIEAAQVVEIAAPIPPFVVCDRPINSGPQHFVLKAAFAALERWIRDGTPPPMAPRLAVAGEPAEFVLDDLGNVRGGIRTPYVDVPIAELSGLGQTGGSFCRLFGTTMLFDEETLASLYPDRETYVTAVNEATDLAVAEGFILEADADLIKGAAQAFDFGT